MRNSPVMGFFSFSQWYPWNNHLMKHLKWPVLKIRIYFLVLIDNRSDSKTWKEKRTYLFTHTCRFFDALVLAAMASDVNFPENASESIEEHGCSHGERVIAESFKVVERTWILKYFWKVLFHSTLRLLIELEIVLPKVYTFNTLRLSNYCNSGLLHPKYDLVQW